MEGFWDMKLHIYLVKMGNIVTFDASRPLKIEGIFNWHALQDFINNLDNEKIDIEHDGRYILRLTLTEFGTGKGKDSLLGYDLRGVEYCHG